MNSWNPNQMQNQNTNMMMGQAQFNAYPQNNLWGNYASQMQRAPVYKADPIHGKEAAWAFPIGGGEIYLPDADQDIIWWIRIDQNGNKQVIPFDVKPHEEPTSVDMNDILARLGAVEEWINGKQNKSNAKRNAAVSANATANVPATTE